MLKLFPSAMLTLCLITGAVTTGAFAQAGPAAAKTPGPQVQALSIYRAIRDQDYKAMYHLLAFTPKGKATLTSADQFALDVRKGYEGSFKTPEEKEATDNIFKSIAEIMMGEAVITGDTALVPTSAKITANGQTRVFKGQAHLIKDDGTWKLDLTFTEDTEQAMAQRVGELFGKPSEAQ